MKLDSDSEHNMEGDKDERYSETGLESGRFTMQILSCGAACVSL